MAVSQQAQTRARARVGTVLNEKWRLDALLGIGGMAAVYRATHRNGKRAALKILHAELSLDSGLVTRFLREGYLANRVEHRGVVSVLDDAQAEDGSTYLVMELLEGYSLERHTRGAETALPLAEVLRVGGDLLDVLAVAHEAGVVHRDIKPANVFLTDDGQVKVLDFGIARLAEPMAGAAMTETGAAIGTPAYMPPEQARGRWSEVDARTDLWAVGATLLALLIGSRPRRAETVQEELLFAMTQPMPAAASLCPSLPPAVGAVLDQALAFDRERRFSDARSMQRELQRSADAAPRSERTIERTVAFTSAPPAADTAPVVHPRTLVNADSTRVEPLMPPNAERSAPPVLAPDPQLTTGRPMWVAPPAPSKPSRGAGAALAAVAGVLVAALLVVGFFWMKHRAAAGASSASAAESAATPDTSEPSPAPPPAMSVPAAALPAPPATTRGEPAASAAEPEAAEPEAAPRASASASARASAEPSPVAPKARPRRRASPSPKKPAPVDTADMFDRRF